MAVRMKCSGTKMSLEPRSLKRATLRLNLRRRMCSPELADCIDDSLMNLFEVSASMVYSVAPLSACLDASLDPFGRLNLDWDECCIQSDSMTQVGHKPLYSICYIQACTDAHAAYINDGNDILQIPPPPRMYSIAACTLPPVARRARTFCAALVKPMSCSCWTQCDEWQTSGYTIR